ncbi:MAG TPA: hypothetical protein VMJ11_21530 [Paraburkholderia sp.]|uniref:hypothetical protein n=1 Tax=Paraburkholderia sp. TaxID=1926495 RepID=UPI002BC7E813|nr:hypothetical protein [Paraburkholderia sp.]HTR09185.1 hypothetical protein [Paraburkholderia sp.]
MGTSDGYAANRAVLYAASLMLLSSCGGNSCIGLGECGTASGPPPVSISGTAATGKALANATVSLNCAQGAGTVLSDSGGNYAISFNGAPPCIVTATSAGTTLHSVAFAGGVFNTTPETELVLVYLAAQLGTSESSLIANFAGNGQFQSVLGSQSDVLAAQSAVVANLQSAYSLTLAVPAFLTTPFVTGQAGVDSDLVALQNAGAIDSNGMPGGAAVSQLTAAGQAHPLVVASTSSSGSGAGVTSMGADR